MNVKVFLRGALYDMVQFMKGKDPHASALGRKGGKARWKGVSPEERTKILRRAVLARWRRAKQARKK